MNTHTPFSLEDCLLQDQSWIKSLIQMPCFQVEFRRTLPTFWGTFSNLPLQINLPSLWLLLSITRAHLQSGQHGARRPGFHPVCMPLLASTPSSLHSLPLWPPQSSFPHTLEKCRQKLRWMGGNTKIVRDLSVLSNFPTNNWESGGSTQPSVGAH